MSLIPRDLVVTLLVVFSLLLGVRALVRRFAADSVQHLRKPNALFVLYAMSAALFLAAHALEWAAASHWLGVACRVLGGLTVVSLLALALLDVLLRVRGRFVPTIVVDLVSAAGYAVVVVLALAESGINPSHAIAGTTVVAAVFTVSLQSTLGNVIGGVALQLDGSIELGDWVQLEGGRVGRVSAIRWRHIVLDTRDGDAVVVPNGLLLAQPFTVLGKRAGFAHPHRQWLHFRVDFRYPPAQVCDVVERALRASPMEHVAADPPVSVVCTELARGDEGSSIYAVRYWLLGLAHDGVVDSGVRACTHAALRRAGIPLALPTIVNLNAEADSAAKRALKEMDLAYAGVRGLELFASLSDDECRRLAEGVRLCPFAPGEVITKQGAVAHFLYIMTAGSAEVRVVRDGQPPLVWELEAPTFFGEMGLLTDEPRRATVRARGHVECFKLERAGLEEVLRHRPAVATELGDALAERQAKLDAAERAPSAAARETGAGFAAAIRRLFDV